MLKLKKIHILGFKSFCDRTELVVPGTGIAVVVGPNGCGKSNILDGVTWVLGEQSAKTLRGGTMQDVIFSGTRDRKALGMAEVSITLVDPEAYEGPIAVEPEVQIDSDMVAGVDGGFDWDEAKLRSERAAEAEEIIAEQQPGRATAEESAAAAQPSPTSAGADAAQLGPQSVVLKIRRRKFTRTPQKGEIVITRRLFRTGESEYLLNGKLCRLRDIQDIFMGTGLGPESYAIIGQERIGQLLSSKPHDRRAIIEEAAGITRFKTKKRLAELRLESSRQNLARIDDIFDEVARQMNSLKRQAAKAERYGALRDELRARLRVTLASRLAWMDAEQARLDGEIARLSAEVDTRAMEIGSLETQQQALTNRGYELDQEAQSAQSRGNAAALELERASARERGNTERIADLEARLASSALELDQVRQQSENLAVEWAQQKSFLESAAGKAKTFRESVAARQQEARASAAEVAEAERQLEACRRHAMQLLTQAGNAQNLTAQAEDSLASYEREALRIENEMTQAREEAAGLGAERGQAHSRLESATAALRQLETSIAELQATLSRSREQEAGLRARSNQLRLEQATLTGRRNSLDALIKSHSYSSDTVRKLLAPGALPSDLAPIGTLADFLDVTGEHEVLLDTFLREELNTIVVKSWRAAEEGIRLLQSSVDGRATFLIQAEPQSEAIASLPLSGGDGGATPLREIVRAVNGLESSLTGLLPKLRQGFLVSDTETARALAAQNPGAWFLSTSGETFHGGTVAGGKPASEGPLAIKRELRDVQAKLTGLEADLAQAEDDTISLARQIEETAAKIEKLSEKRRIAERETANQSAALKQMQLEVDRVQRRLEEWTQQAARNQEVRAAKQALIAQKQEEATRLEAEHKLAESKLDQMQASLAMLRHNREILQQDAARVTAELAGLEERRRGAESAFQRIERLHADLERRIQQMEQARDAADAERSQRMRESETLAARQQELTLTRNQAQEEAATLAAEAVSLRRQLAVIEQQLKAQRVGIDTRREARSTLLSQLAKLKSDLEHLEASCVLELSLEAAKLREETAAHPGFVHLQGEALDQEEEASRALRQKLEAMGPVNMMALEEYQETAQRHQFLETQRRDLIESIENTQSTIKEIDQISRVKFDEAFARINENFAQVFTRLFHGGQAFLRLTDAENQAESGLEIVASPPGKKLQNVLLLSGGEKALTALSLLMGIFQYQPSPFCVLDEVDAALDETNVGRLADLLDAMSHDTQFLLVTHSKRMMQAADMIYGVTMQEPGVSKIVSVHLGGQGQRATA